MRQVFTVVTLSRNVRRAGWSHREAPWHDGPKKRGFLIVSGTMIAGQYNEVLKVSDQQVWMDLGA